MVPALEMKDPAFIKKMEKGPVAFISVLENKAPSMTANLIQWFVYCVVVRSFAAYIAGWVVVAGLE